MIGLLCNTIYFRFGNGPKIRFLIKKHNIPDYKGLMSHGDFITCGNRFKMF